MTKSGFTLIELLVVTLVIVLLAALAIYAVAPFELIKLRHDADRSIDLGSLQYSINSSIYEATSSALVSTLCKEAGKYPCSGSSHRGNKNNDGSGWVKVQVPTELPQDPVNDSTYHYSYCADSDGWEISTVFESADQIDKMKTDGGNEDDKFEIGTNLNLIAREGGSCIY